MSHFNPNPGFAEPATAPGPIDLRVTPVTVTPGTTTTTSASSSSLVDAFNLVLDLDECRSAATQVPAKQEHDHDTVESSSPAPTAFVDAFSVDELEDALEDALAEEESQPPVAAASLGSSSPAPTAFVDAFSVDELEDALEDALAEEESQPPVAAASLGSSSPAPHAFSVDELEDALEESQPPVAAASLGSSSPAPHAFSVDELEDALEESQPPVAAASLGSSSPAPHAFSVDELEDALADEESQPPVALAPTVAPATAPAPPSVPFSFTGGGVNRILQKPTLQERSCQFRRETSEKKRAKKYKQMIDARRSGPMGSFSGAAATAPALPIVPAAVAPAPPIVPPTPSVPQPRPAGRRVRFAAMKETRTYQFYPGEEEDKQRVMHFLRGYRKVLVQLKDRVHTLMMARAVRRVEQRRLEKLRVMHFLMGFREVLGQLKARAVHCLEKRRVLEQLTGLTPMVAPMPTPTATAAPQQPVASDVRMIVHDDPCELVRASLEHVEKLREVHCQLKKSYKKTPPTISTTSSSTKAPPARCLRIRRPARYPLGPHLEALARAQPPRPPLMGHIGMQPETVEIRDDTIESIVTPTPPAATAANAAVAAPRQDSFASDDSAGALEEPLEWGAVPPAPCQATDDDDDLPALLASDDDAGAPEEPQECGLWGPVPHELEPAFLDERQYPDSWLVYHPELRVVTRQEAQKYDREQAKKRQQQPSPPAVLPVQDAMMVPPAPRREIAEFVSAGTNYNETDALVQDDFVVEDSEHEWLDGEATDDDNDPFPSSDDSVVLPPQLATLVDTSSPRRSESSSATDDNADGVLEGGLEGATDDDDAPADDELIAGPVAEPPTEPVFQLRRSARIAQLVAVQNPVQPRRSARIAARPPVSYVGMA